MNRSQRNNNPGNIRFAGQKGAVKGPDGFAVFTTSTLGWEALLHQIKLDQARGMTISQFVSKYAPNVENNTAGYLSFVYGGLKGSPDDPLSDYAAYAIAGMVAAYEGYFAEVDPGKPV